MKSIVDLISYIEKQKNGVENDGIDFMTLKISSMKLLQNSYNAKRNIVQNSSVLRCQSANKLFSDLTLSGAIVKTW